tara:strand:+ start:318 stop:1097 length:780 start_codon:yes stop_codon:yes gene_type:complete
MKLKKKDDNNVIHITRDYSMFKSVKGNRAIDKGHVQKLIREMKKKDLDLPIFINENDEVVDGQHTLQARKELGRPVRYIRGKFENEFDVAIMNANRKNWPMTAYLNFHIENGKKDYQIIKAMTKQYSLPLECAIFLLAGGYSMWRETRADFKQGKFKIKTLQRCNEIGADLMFMKNNFNIRLTRSFITAYAVVSEHPKFKWDRFKTALKSKSALLLRGTNTEDFVRVFDKIYNGNVHNKINFVRYFVDREYQDGEEDDN